MSEDTEQQPSLEEMQRELKTLQAERETLEIEMLQAMEEKRIQELQEKLDA